MANLVCYHSPCADGFTSAWVAWRVLGDEGTIYRPMRYGDAAAAESIQPTKADVIFVLDFAFDEVAMGRLARAARRMVWLDHHQSAITALGPLFERLALDGVVTSTALDVTQSGARLTWEYFHDPTDPPEPLVEYVEDRDLWRWALPDSRNINAVVKSTPQEFGDWTQLAARLRAQPGRMAADGAAMRQMEARLVSSLCDEAVWVRMPHLGYPVPMVNCPGPLTSEAGEALCRRHPLAPFALMYFDRSDGRRQWGMRSRAVGPDLGAYAREEFGGGGHAQAAGFETETSWRPDPTVPREGQ